MYQNIFKLILLLTLASCLPKPNNEPLSEETWRLGWRMIENSWNKKYALAERQFDSLLNSEVILPEKFLVNGLLVKSKLLKQNEFNQLLSHQSKKVIDKFCQKEPSNNYSICSKVPKEKVKNKKLQRDLINMFVRDQAIRGNMMLDLISKYQIDTTDIKTKQDWSNPDEVSVDELNRNQLKLIFEEFGFPTTALVGTDAMRGIFLIIQHSDGDKAWQKLQLPKLTNAVQNGDLTKSNYAYLFDRIRVNEGRPQRYGSQFETVNRKMGIAKLRKTENIDSLDIRRREMEMMPMETYRRLILNQ